jgi:hypothetical protein
MIQKKIGQSQNRMSLQRESVLVDERLFRKAVNQQLTYIEHNDIILDFSCDRHV